MILDKFRLQLEIDASNLSQDAKDTIEFFFEIGEDYIKGNEELEKQIADLKKPKVEAEKIIFAKFDSTCKACGGPTKTGTKVLWTPGVGVKHVPGECKNSPM